MPTLQLFIRYCLLWAICALISPSVWAQIVDNDACPDAYDFGTMANGTQECYASNNIGANAELPYINQGYCFGAGDVPVPAADVWFQFTAAGNLLDILITSELDTLMIALYEGSCDALIGRKCAVVPGAGFISTTFAPVTTGQSYYLQISGGSESDVGNYNICLTSYQVQTDICIIDQSITLDPLPYLGTYLAGQTVNVCLTIGGYFQNSADWFDGLVPIFGNGWDLTTLQVYPPPACDGSGGTWGWYDSVTGTGNNSPGPIGPGFFFDRNNDGNPGNDFGDNSDGDACDWVFCMDITSKSCPPGNNADDLSISFENYSDSEAGSWNASGSPCLNDPTYVMKSLLTCCPIPLMSGVPPSCADPQSGSITAISDSEPPMIFVWSNGFTETTMGTSVLSGVGVGFYTVTVTDNNDCTQVASFELENADIPYIVVNYLQPSTCASGNGVCHLAVYNGVAPYTYSMTLDGTSETITQTTPNFSGLQGGTYTIAVTDAGGCSNTLGVEVVSLNSLSVTITTTDTSCPGASDGSISVSATGLPPFTYGINGGTLSSNNVFAGLAEGTYTIEVADNPALDCHVTYEAIIGSSAPINSNATTTPESCLGAANGAATLIGNNGIAPNQYSINGGAWQSDSVFASLTSGTYSYAVQAANGCTANGTFSISANSAPTATAALLSEVLCAGGSDASFEISFSSSATPYTYTTNGGAAQNSALFEQLSSGTYNYTATDANGCQATGTLTIAEPDVLSIDAGGNVSLLQGGSATLTASTQSGSPSSYVWSPTQGLDCTTCNPVVASPTASTTYAVTATDANGCTARDSVRVEVLAALSVLVPSGFTPNDDGVNDLLYPTVLNVPTYTMVIYNRWGQKVYEGDQSSAGWDGKWNDTPQAVGVYVYYFNGTDANGQEVIRKGNTAILR